MKIIIGEESQFTFRVKSLLRSEGMSCDTKMRWIQVHLSHLKHFLVVVLLVITVSILRIYVKCFKDGVIKLEKCLP